MKIEYHAIDTAGELYERFNKRNDVVDYILGEDCEHVKSVGELAVSNNSLKIRIGILSSRDTLPKIIQNGGVAFVGFDCEVDIISLVEPINRYRASSTFFDFIMLENEDVLSIFEIDVFCFDKYGKIRWKYGASDIITDYKVSNGLLNLSFLDSNNKIISVISGVESQNAIGDG